MTTYYLDLEGGSDAADGLSFANRWLTFSKANSVVAAGDTVRVKGSAPPTNTGVNATWVAAKQGASKSIVSSTNASPIVMTVTGHGYSNNDYVSIVSHATNTFANGMWKIANVTADTFELIGSTGNGVGGATGTVFLSTNRIVTLSAALNQTIASTGNLGEGRTAWTTNDGANVTVTTATQVKESDVCDSIAIGAGFTTGLAAYKNTGTLNLSGYQGVTFWIRQAAGTVAVAGDIELTLCTSTNGVTAVHHVSIPAIGSLSVYIPVYWDNGSALNSAIVSVGINVLVDRGAQTFLLNNIVAVKASSGVDGLHFRSLIGKSPAANEPWWPVQSISGTRIILDVGNTTLSSSVASFGYDLTSSTEALYKKEPVKTTITSGTQNTLSTNGSVGSPITYDGGWDRTNMSTRTLDTLIDGAGLGLGFSISGTYITFTNFGILRYSTGISTTSTSIVTAVLTMMGMLGIANNAQAGGFYTITIDWLYCCSNTGLSMNGKAGSSYVVNYGIVNCVTGVAGGSVSRNSLVVNGPTINCSQGYTVQGLGITCQLAGIRDCSTALSFNNSAQAVSCVIDIGGAMLNNTNHILVSQVFAAPGTVIRNGSTSGSSNAAVVFSPNGPNELTLVNFAIAESPEVSFSFPVYGSRLISHNHDQTIDNHKIFFDVGTVASATDQRHTASGISWKFTPTSTACVALNPLFLSLGRVAIQAGSATSIGVWCRRDNTNISGILSVLKGAGVSAEVTTACAPSINTWTRYTLSVTPTENCVVEVLFKVYDGVDITNSFWIDDLTVN